MYESEEWTLGSKWNKGKNGGYRLPKIKYKDKSGSITVAPHLMKVPEGYEWSNNEWLVYNIHTNWWDSIK